MLKKIWMPFLALAIVSCSSDDNNEIEMQNSTKTVLAHKEATMTVKDWASVHVLSYLKCTTILSAEIENGYKFDSNKILPLIANAKDVKEVEAILADSGLRQGAITELVTIAGDINDNNVKLYTLNPEFVKLTDEEQTTQLVDGINNFFLDGGQISHPTSSNPKYVTSGKCYDQYLKDSDRCLQDSCKEAAVATAIGLVLEDPTAIISILYSIHKGQVCHDNAVEDYWDCRNGK
jgi:hypothetical protein